MASKKSSGLVVTLLLCGSLLAGPATVTASPKDSSSEARVVSFARKVANRPTVLSVTASKVKSKRVTVTVRLRLGKKIRGASPLGSEVRIGKNICRIDKSRTKCTIRNVKVGTKLRISARTRNKWGFGGWSKSVTFRARSGNKWSHTTTTPTPVPAISTSPPGPRVDLTRTRVLGATNVKLAKIEGIGSGGVSSASVSSRRAQQVRSASSGNVTFLTAGTVAFAQADQANQTGSKLLAVTASGQLTDAVLGGSAVVRDFFTAPDGFIYVVFESKVPLTTGGTPCLLARVDPVSGASTCVDTTLDSISWSLGNVHGNSPIQFDANGAVYYVGQAAANQVLRRYSNGSIFNLINDNIYIRDFVVLDDGRAIVAGTTNSTQAQWLRRIMPSGGLKNLALGSVHSIWRYADGRVYVGLWGSNDYGVKRYLAETDALEAKFWISGNTNGVERDAYFSAGGTNQNLCLSDPQDPSTWNRDMAFCGWYGTVSMKPFNLTGELTFAVAGGSSEGRQLWQYYPVVEKANVTRINSVTVATQARSSIVVAGTDAQGTNLVSTYDPASKQETVVLDGTNQIEMYTMSYSERTNSILFSGLRFADGQFVVGEISLS